MFVGIRLILMVLFLMVLFVNSGCKSDPGWYKINFDGAIFSDLKHSGVGVLAVLSSKEQELSDFVCVEALAAYRAVSFVVDMGFGNFCLESLLGLLWIKECGLKKSLFAS